jgi:hypothetical protein
MTPTNDQCLQCAAIRPHIDQVQSVHKLSYSGAALPYLHSLSPAFVHNAHDSLDIEPFDLVYEVH